MNRFKEKDYIVYETPNYKTNYKDYHFGKVTKVYTVKNRVLGCDVILCILNMDGTLVPVGSSVYIEDGHCIPLKEGIETIIQELESKIKCYKEKIKVHKILYRNGGYSNDNTI